MSKKVLMFLGFMFSVLNVGLAVADLVIRVVKMKDKSSDECE